MILYLKHIDIEGPCTIGSFFELKGFQNKILELGSGGVFPQDLKNIEAVVILGGPMSVYEEDKHPYLKQEDVFIKEVLISQIPLLGICLGAQLIAKACGARINKAENKEIGWSKVSLTQEGQGDILFENVLESLDVFQWHEDTFSIPANGTLLATSSHCAHQAFKVGPSAYGLQFHIEITEQSISSWCDAYFPLDKEKYLGLKEEMLKQYQSKKDVFNAQAEKVYRNFLKLIKK